MWHLTACRISVSLSFLKWNDFLSYLWLNVANISSDTMYNKNHFIFDLAQKRESNWNVTGCQMPQFMIVLIPYINLLNLCWILIDCVGVLWHINACGSFCVISQRKGEKEIVEEMKDRDREERETGMKEKKQEIKTFPSILTCYKDSKPCPTVSQYHRVT